MAPYPGRGAYNDAMLSRSAAAFFLANFFVAALAFGQEAAEFGRASGGAVDTTAKATNQFSFSLGMSVARGGSSPFLSGSGQQYNATAGGAIVPDRLWFFGTAQLARELPRFTNADLAKIAGQVGTASRNPAFATALPSSFQSLHFTGIVSSSNSFSVTASQQKSQMQFVPAAPTP